MTSTDPILQRIKEWADQRPDIVALVQIGSRVQAGAQPDEWSDYDFQLVTRRPADYRDTGAIAGLGPLWAAAAQPTFGGVTKVTAILPGAAEADFAVISHAEVRIAFAALRWPALEHFWPSPLRAGVRDLRIVACPGWRIIKGGPAWEQRYARLGTAVPWPPLDEARFRAICSAYWTGLVWVTKKTLRGELRAAQREFHRHLAEQVWLLLEHEARTQSDAAVRPEARRAERWLAASRVAGTALATATDATALKTALRQLHTLFEETSSTLARARGWPQPVAPALREWFLQQSA